MSTQLGQHLLDPLHQLDQLLPLNLEFLVALVVQLNLEYLVGLVGLLDPLNPECLVDL
jgi:hypothetical protein